MALMLTSTQQTELNKSLLGYFEALGLTEVAEEFMREAKVDKDPKFKDMLEKKWRSILRLEKRIDDLVEANRDISDQMQRFGSEGKVVETEALPDLERRPRHVVEGHRGPITHMVFHPRFNLLATASEDGSVKVWDADSGAYERTLNGHKGEVLWCEFSPDGTMLATASADTSVLLWDCGKDNDGSFTVVKTLVGHEHTVSCATFSKDGEWLYTASRDKTIKVWEVGTGHLKQTLTGHTDWVKVVTVSPDQTMLASCGLDQTVMVWDLKTGQPHPALRDHDHVVETVAWSNAKADSNIIEYILDDDDKKVAGAQLRSNKEAGKVPGGMFLVSGSRDRTMRLWLVAEGVCVKTIRGHDSWVRCVLFHPSGSYMLTCSDDKTVRIWDLVRYGRCKAKGQCHDSFISCLSWNMHSPMMATGCVDNSVKIWECA